MNLQPHYLSPAAPISGITWSNLAFATMQILAAIAFAAQLGIDPTSSNLESALLTFVSSTLTIQYLRISKAFDFSPISSFSVLGLCVTTQWGALVAQSAALTSLSTNLHDPLRTFSLLLGFQCIAILAHIIHRNVQGLVRIRKASSFLLSKTGLFEIPSPLALWTFGLLGLSFLAVSRGNELANGIESAGLADRLMAGFWPFSWAPFLIPILHQRFGRAYCNITVHALALGVYVALAVVVAMAINNRATMVTGITTGALMAILMTLQSRSFVSPKLLLKLFPVAIVAFLFAGITTDLATAMLLARANRGHASPIELLQETLEHFQDKDALKKQRETFNSDSKFSAYDESYISSALVSRFVTTKFEDNTFYFGRDLTDWEREGFSQEISNRLWALLPYPLLRALGVNADKSNLSHSPGDFYANLRTGVPLDGLKTGSLLADCLSLFEDFAPIAYLLICLAFYFIWDIQAQATNGTRTELSVFVMLQVQALFSLGINNESLSGGLAIFVRGFWQNVAFYLLAYLVLRIFFPPFRASQWKQAH